MIGMPGDSYSGPFQPLTPQEAALQERLAKHVQTLGDEIGERNVMTYEALESAAGYIETTFQEAGYTTVPQEYTVQGKVVRNIEVEIPGDGASQEIVVIGAHYDSVFGCPGANDNATGVAALLEIARSFSGRRAKRTVRFVAFVNEEPPFFLTGQMGSLVYATRSKERGEDIVAMLSLETIGYYTDTKGSQQYPFPFSLFYPDTGNFIGFVGNLASRSLVREAIGSFRRHTAFPSEGVAAPGWITGIGWSDHWSFWKQGYPGVMVTDTAPFRYAHYHSVTDTPDRVTYERMARVVMGLDKVVSDLARVKE